MTGGFMIGGLALAGCILKQPVGLIDQVEVHFLPDSGAPWVFCVSKTVHFRGGLIR
jgi:hypothetical protein